MVADVVAPRYREGFRVGDSDLGFDGRRDGRAGSLGSSPSSSMAAPMPVLPAAVMPTATAGTRGDESPTLTRGFVTVPKRGTAAQARRRHSLSSLLKDEASVSPRRNETMPGVSASGMLGLKYPRYTG